MNKIILSLTVFSMSIVTAEASEFLPNGIFKDGCGLDNLQKEEMIKRFGPGKRVERKIKNTHEPEGPESLVETYEYPDSKFTFYSFGSPSKTLFLSSTLSKTGSGGFIKVGQKKVDIEKTFSAFKKNILKDLQAPNEIRYDSLEGSTSDTLIYKLKNDVVYEIVCSIGLD